nr:TIM barrel protein [Salsipaludibacter albus]
MEEYGDLWDDYQVRPVASHSSLDLDTWDQTLADAKALNQKYVGSGGFGGPGFGSLEDTLQTAENLNELGERALKQGLRLYVHNHDREFTTTYMYDLDGDGDLEETPVIEIVLAETDPRYVSLELDVHWARIGLAGGRGSDDLADNLADPSNQEMLVDFIEQYEDRIVFLHVKDTTTDGGFADVGEGTTDWGDVFRAATSVEHYFIEYDFPPDPYASVEDSWEYLTCLTF